ncbi:MAG: hypothetical protein HZA54_20385 [Planctomycetes bacterium]|nr:hypothetical protein [Planctomycetota bacterium]
MTWRSIGLVGVLDESFAVARRAAPWIGLLWLTALPARLLGVRLEYAAHALGATAADHGDYLISLGYAAALALPLALYGRLVFVRACARALRSGVCPGLDTLRVPPAAAACYLYAALLVEVLFYATGLALVTVPVLVVFAGLAAATAERCERPGLIHPLREILRACTHGRLLAALVFVFATALLLAEINFYFGLRGALWLAEAAGPFDAARWEHALRPATWWVAQVPYPEQKLPALLLESAATAAVEPFWLAALVVYVQQLWTKESGEDLSRRFELLRAGEAA